MYIQISDMHVELNVPPDSGIWTMAPKTNMLHFKKMSVLSSIPSNPVISRKILEGEGWSMVSQAEGCCDCQGHHHHHHHHHPYHYISSHHPHSPAHPATASPTSKSHGFQPSTCSDSNGGTAKLQRAQSHRRGGCTRHWVDGVHWMSCPFCDFFRNEFGKN